MGSGGGREGEGGELRGAHAYDGTSEERARSQVGLGSIVDGRLRKLIINSGRWAEFLLLSLLLLLFLVCSIRLQQGARLQRYAAVAVSGQVERHRLPEDEYGSCNFKLRSPHNTVAFTNFRNKTSPAIAGGGPETTHEGDKNVIMGKCHIGGGEGAASRARIYASSMTGIKDNSTLCHLIIMIKGCVGAHFQKDY